MRSLAATGQSPHIGFVNNIVGGQTPTIGGWPLRPPGRTVSFMGVRETAQARDLLLAADRPDASINRVCAAALEALHLTVRFDWAALMTTDHETLLPTGGLVEGFSPDTCAPFWDTELLDPDFIKFRELAVSTNPIATLHHATEATSLGRLGTPNSSLPSMLPTNCASRFLLVRSVSPLPHCCARLQTDRSRMRNLRTRATYLPRLVKYFDVPLAESVSKGLAPRRHRRSYFSTLLVRSSASPKAVRPFSTISGPLGSTNKACRPSFRQLQPEPDGAGVRVGSLTGSADGAANG